MPVTLETIATRQKADEYYQIQYRNTKVPDCPWQDQGPEFNNRAGYPIEALDAAMARLLQERKYFTDGGTYEYRLVKRTVYQEPVDEAEALQVVNPATVAEERKPKKLRVYAWWWHGNQKNRALVAARTKRHAIELLRRLREVSDDERIKWEETSSAHELSVAYEPGVWVDQSAHAWPTDRQWKRLL